VLHDVLEDEKFQFDARPARGAHEAAVLLLDWTTQENNFSAIKRVSGKPSRVLS